MDTVAREVPPPPSPQPSQQIIVLYWVLDSELFTGQWQHTQKNTEGRHSTYLQESCCSKGLILGSESSLFSLPASVADWMVWDS